MHPVRDNRFPREKIRNTIMQARLVKYAGRLSS